MARIRTIKPEFPQSESMGRVSREARLLFILLWTIVDDEGRSRASSRMLASLLYPYDEDVNKKIGRWLQELQHEQCVLLYEIEGNSYLQIEKWLSHQKIDRPSKSRLPAPLARAREDSRSLAADLVPSTLDQDMDLEGKGIIRGSAVADEPAMAVAIYNTLADEVGWSKVLSLTDPRKQQVAARLRQAGGIEGWRKAMAKARASPFLRGDQGRNKAHSNWAPNFDFFLQQKSFTQLIEGQFDQRNNNQAPEGFDALIAGARAVAAQ